MKNRGFTLIELVIGMAAGVAVALFAFMLFAPIENWMFTQSRRGGISGASVAVMRMEKEIMRVKTPSNILTLAPEQLRFVDIDGNTVSFQKSGTDLLRGSDVLARDVSSLTFTYLDKDGIVTAIAANVRVIKVNIAITSGTQTVRLETAALIRNLS